MASRLKGVAAAPGVARGAWTLLTTTALPPPRSVAADAADAEVDRLKAAATEVGAELRALAASVREAGHPDEASIFTAHAAIARDPDLIEAAAGNVREEGIDAATAVARAADVAAERIGALDDPLLRGRATDVLDVGQRIARRLVGLPPSGVQLTAPTIIVAEDLAPSVTATLPREHVLAIALQGSSPTSHAAILARAYGIPAVMGVAGLLTAAAAAGPELEMAVDGSSGEVVIGPDADDVARFTTRAHDLAEAGRKDREEAGLPAVTTDGVAVTLMANIGNPDDASRAAAVGASGVGLFRTEFLFLERSQPPSEDEQADAYRRAVEAFAGDPVTIRLLDIGGDKAIPYLPVEPEANPFLGVRALRLAHRHPDLFVTQVRACMRAAVAGPVRVMAPMIADASDVDDFLSLAGRARDGLEADGLPWRDVELGVMLEIPSSVLALASFASRISFASIGTNDLLQYTLAVDRGNAALERYRDPMHPAHLRLIGMAVEASEAAGLSLSVCGEMAGDPATALALVGLGIRGLSMVPPSLPAVRRAIRDASAAELKASATAAFAAESAAEARASFQV
jgi:phosphoenolpyruvate-protein phosphotransferase